MVILMLALSLNCITNTRLPHTPFKEVNFGCLLKAANSNTVCLKKPSRSILKLENNRVELIRYLINFEKVFQLLNQNFSCESLSICRTSQLFVTALGWIVFQTLINTIARRMSIVSEIKIVINSLK